VARASGCSTPVPVAEVAASPSRTRLMASASPCRLRAHPSGVLASASKTGMACCWESSMARPAWSSAAAGVVAQLIEDGGDDEGGDLTQGVVDGSGASERLEACVLGAGVVTGEPSGPAERGLPRRGGVLTVVGDQRGGARWIDRGGDARKVLPGVGGASHEQQRPADCTFSDDDRLVVESTRQLEKRRG
jgi:hypothetical protein